MFSGFSSVRRLLALAIPMMLATFFQTVMNQMINILAGQLPKGEDTIAQLATQLSQILLWIFSSLLCSISVGTQVLVARRMGQNDSKEAGQVAFNSLIWSLFTSIPLTLMCWLIAPTLMRLAHSDPHVQEVGTHFVRLRFLTLPAMVLFASLKAFFDAQGNARISLRSGLISNGLTFILCIALMYGAIAPSSWGLHSIHHGLSWLSPYQLPHLGIYGAGIAALIGSYVGMFFLLFWSFRKKYRSFQMYSLQNISKNIIKTLTQISIPSGFSDMFTMLSFFFLLFVVGKLDAGPNPTLGAASGNVLSILLLVFMTCISFGTATSTLVSQQLGAKQTEQAETYIKTAFFTGTLLFGIIGIGLFIKAPWVLKIWNSQNEEVLQKAIPLLKLVSAFMPVIAFALIAMQALYAAGLSRFVLTIAIFLQLGIFYPGCYLLALYTPLGVWGAWSAILLYVVLLGLILYIKIRTGSWKQNRL